MSDIQHTIYRVDKHVNTSQHIIGNFLDQLNKWKQPVPVQCTQELQSAAAPTNELDPLACLHLRDSYVSACRFKFESIIDKFQKMIPYFTCIRFLLFPQLTGSTVNTQYLKGCATACAGICRSYKRLYQNPVPICFLPISTMSLFLAGEFSLSP
jgi:hypothetical protein